MNKERAGYEQNYHHHHHSTDCSGGGGGGNHHNRTLSSSSVDYSAGRDVDLVRDQLFALLFAEETYLVQVIPCRAPHRHLMENTDRVPLEEWRRKICQWAFRVIDHFRLDREVVSTGMNLFDRFLMLHEAPCNNEDGDDICCRCPSCKRSLDSRTYQLASMTCIFLAVKLHSQNGAPEASNSRRRQFRLSAFVELSRGQFQEADIVQMEQTILGTLRWKVNPPTPMTFVTYLVTLMPSREMMPTSSQTYYNLVIHVLRELSRYLTELAVCVGGGCSSYAPSQVAYAAILVSMDLLTIQALPLQVREAFSQEYAQICGVSCHPNVHGPIPHLRSMLQRALWPEMLLDDNEDYPADAGHPISIARDYGLLDLDRIYRAQGRNGDVSSYSNGGRSVPAPGGQTPPGSPKRSGSFEESPVSVVRR